MYNTQKLSPKTYQHIIYATNRLSFENREQAKKDFLYDLFWKKYDKNSNYPLIDMTENQGISLLNFLDTLNNYCCPY